MKFMKHHPLWITLVLASCASVPPPSTDQEFEALAQKAIGTLTTPDPIELTLVPDYIGERLTLVRGTTIKEQPNAPKITIKNDDQPAGMLLGNGLFLDSLNSLSVRPDVLAGVGPDFKGSTDFWRERPGSAFRLHAEYSDDWITVDDRTAMLNGNYRVDRKSESQAVKGVWLSHKGDSYQILSTTPSTLTKTDTGIRKSWTEGLEFSLGGPRTLDYTFRSGRVFDRSGDNLRVEPRGLGVRVVYGFGPQASYRLYKSAAGTVVISEDTGSVIVFLKTDTGLDWQSLPNGAALSSFRADGRLTVRPQS